MATMETHYKNYLATKPAIILSFEDWKVKWAKDMKLDQLTEILEKERKCPKCGEKEDLRDNYDLSVDEMPYVDTTCNKCKENFK